LVEKPDRIAPGILSSLDRVDLQAYLYSILSRTGSMPDCHRVVEI
jgi:hypothetical protein